MGGGAMHVDLSMIQFCTTSSSKLSSLSSSSLNFPVSANSAATSLGQSCYVSSSCACNSDSCKRLDSVDKSDDKRASGSLDKSVLGPVPSILEVENAVSALQSFMHGNSSSGPELKWLQPLLGICDPSILLSQGYGRRVYDTYRMLLTDPSVKRLVISLSSDKAVWDAVMNNELVRELRQSPYPVENRRRNISDDEEPNAVADIVRWILNTTKAKVAELIEKFQALMDEVFKQPLHRGKATSEEEARGDMEEKIRSSLFLSLVILLIVVVARAQAMIS